MIIVKNLQGNNIKFVWEQFPLAKSTTCRAINIDMAECTHKNNNECTIGIAIAYCGPNDNYSRKEGAKIAFEKLLKNLTKTMNKAERKEYKRKCYEALFSDEATSPREDIAEVAAS